MGLTILLIKKVTWRLEVSQSWDQGTEMNCQSLLGAVKATHLQLLQFKSISLITSKLEHFYKYLPPIYIFLSFLCIFPLI